MLTFHFVILESDNILSDMSENKFLTHVAGLRALAILLVVWFHIALCNRNLPEWASLPCGYFGVDIFLVIMGYFLITGFVRRPSYSLRDFARGKAMRILPPLAIMLMVAFIACMWCMDFKELRAIAKTGLGALLGYSNYQLIDSSAGYFAEDSTLNAYLHTWYLALTLQVFVLAYALYYLLRKSSRRVVLLVLGAISILSLLWHQSANIRVLWVSMGLPHFGPDELVSYYDTLPRLWEVAAGGLVLLLPDVRNRVLSFVLSLLGLLLVLVPSFSGKGEFDMTPLVVVGVILIIRYFADTRLHYLFSNSAAQWLGKISFSVYLVHMPLVVMYRAYTLEAPGLAYAVVILVASVFIGYGFWWAVEKRRISWKPALGVWIAALALCGIADATRGLQKIWNADINAIDIPKYTEWEGCYSKELLTGLDTDIHKDEGGWHTLAAGKSRKLDTPLLWLGTRNQQASFVLLGDSHAQAFFAGFDICCKKYNITGVYFSSIMIPFWNREVLPVTQQYFYNRAKGESFIQWLKSQPQIKTVVVAQYWTRLSSLNLDWDRHPVSSDIEESAKALREFCLQVKSSGKQLVFMGPLPNFEESKMLSYARWLARKGMPLDAVHAGFIRTKDEHDKMFAKEVAVLRSLQDEGLCHVCFPAEAMFENGSIKAIDKGVILYKDGNHVTGVGSAKILDSQMPALLPLLTGTP